MYGISCLIFARCHGHLDVVDHFDLPSSFHNAALNTNFQVRSFPICNIIVYLMLQYSSEIIHHSLHYQEWSLNSSCPITKSIPQYVIKVQFKRYN